ncbi:hypothetical protein [Antrihabitans cavernicola]|uniref:Antitoxin VbhA domain-containing protein n=1 Tax=Antrihabitans cavernicola TaxID=2495913 RepID=A0A5A7S611_9NOCA|nr:hypothetical protein [Spelaeibacter cavernicola]KAA0017660.1 hypothetical protein FOY51_24795 [Spelaeibacter cavernicola]
MTWEPCKYARRWPELWAPLTSRQRRELSDSLGDDDAVPTRSDVADLADYVAGSITAEQYQQHRDWRAVSAETPRGST